MRSLETSGLNSLFHTLEANQVALYLHVNFLNEIISSLRGCHTINKCIKKNKKQTKIQVQIWPELSNKQEHIQKDIKM